MGKRENAIEQYLRRKVLELNGLCYKFNSPTQRGVPDRICIFPWGLLVFVEVKSENGVLSKLQELQIEDLQRCRQPVAILSSTEDVKKFITWAKKLKEDKDEAARNE